MLSIICLACSLVTTTELPTGWQWEIKPTEIQFDHQELFELGDTGTLLANWGEDRFVARFVQSKSEDDARTEQNGRGNAYMLVVETPDGTVQHTSNSSMGNRNQKVHQWMYDSIDASQAATIGLMLRTEEGSRLISEEAIAQGRSEGINLMPLAVVGESFSFDLPGIDGVRIDTREYLGKFVLIDNWATWCGPCMEKMPQLRELNDTWNAKGLQVIGIDWDRDVDKGKKAIEREGQTWPQINPYTFIGDHLTLWNKACGIDTLPYLVLLDTNGKVKAAGRPHHVLEITQKALNGTLPPKMPNYTLPMIAGMSTSQIRQALVEVSQARKFARGKPQMQDSLTYQFNILMGGLKNSHNAPPNSPGNESPRPSNC